MTLIKLLLAHWEALPVCIQDCLFGAILEQKGSLHDQWGLQAQRIKINKKKTINQCLLLLGKKCHIDSR